MAAVSTQLNNFILPASSAQDAKGEAGWLARLGAWFTGFRTRENDREIARFIEARGGRLTDDLERQIARLSF